MALPTFVQKHALSAVTAALFLLAIVRLGLSAELPAVLVALGLKKSAFQFGHGREHKLEDGRHFIDSYHCSRYNTSTKVLTEEMFRTVVARACKLAGI